MGAGAEGSGHVRRLQEALRASEVDLVAVAPGSNLRYLLGFTPISDERVCALLVGREETAFVVPALNAEQVAAHTGLELLTWTDDQGPAEALRAAARRLGRVRTVAFDETMRADTLVPVRDAFVPERAVLSTPLLGALRMRKTADELAAIERSALLADRAMAEGYAACRAGATELEVAWAVQDRFRRDGAEAVDFTIIASGPNGAFPHHNTGERRLARGEAVVLDIGATLEGYKSDITRMAHLGQPADEFRRAFDAVLEANRRAREAVRPGIPAREVDRAAREALAARGLGDYFVHRTGHGLGLDGHEPPYISSTSETVLAPGMVFSVEPGVYLPGKFGVRLEDIVAVTETGGRTLTGSPHDLSIR